MFCITFSRHIDTFIFCIIQYATFPTKIVIVITRTASNKFLRTYVGFTRSSDNSSVVVLHEYHVFIDFLCSLRMRNGYLVLFSKIHDSGKWLKNSFKYVIEVVHIITYIPAYDMIDKSYNESRSVKSVADHKTSLHLHHIYMYYMTKL